MEAEHRVKHCYFKYPMKVSFALSFLKSFIDSRHWNFPMFCNIKLGI